MKPLIKINVSHILDAAVIKEVFVQLVELGYKTRSCLKPVDAPLDWFIPTTWLYTTPRGFSMMVDPNHQSSIDSLAKHEAEFNYRELSINDVMNATPEDFADQEIRDKEGDALGTQAAREEREVNTTEIIAALKYENLSLKERIADLENQISDFENKSVPGLNKISPMDRFKL